MSEKNAFLDVVGYSPQAKILDVLITGREFDYSPTGIIRGADIGRATFYQVFPKLLKAQFVIKTRKLGNIQLYKINKKHPIMLALIELHKQIIMSILKNYPKESEQLEVTEPLVA